MGLFRLGFLANFLSHPVIAGFITASGLIIAASQLKHILGIKAGGHNLFELLTFRMLGPPRQDEHHDTFIIGVAAIAFLFWVRKGTETAAHRARLVARAADIAAKAGPVAAVAVTTLVTWLFGLDKTGVADRRRKCRRACRRSHLAELSTRPMGQPWPARHFSFRSSASWNPFPSPRRLLPSDASASCPDQELIGLGASNIASSLCGGYPVTGGFARSVVNFDAGAETPAAGAFTAVGIALATLAPDAASLLSCRSATLAATIIVAVLSLVDFSILKRTWNYSKADFAAVAATILVTLGFGVELGVSAGVCTLDRALSLQDLDARTSPKSASCPAPSTSATSSATQSSPATAYLTIRVDESLYFANARFLEDLIYDRIAADPGTEARRPDVLRRQRDRHQRPGIARGHQPRLARRPAVSFHLSEVKGPVMDRLKRTHFLDDLTGQVFLSQFQAAVALDGDLVRRAGEAMEPTRAA